MILDADIRGFFDQVSHEWTMEFVRHRINPTDGSVLTTATARLRVRWFATPFL